MIGECKTCEKEFKTQKWMHRVFCSRDCSYTPVRKKALSGVKMCSMCKQQKPATKEFFYLSKTSLNGFGSGCKECIKKYQRFGGNLVKRCKYCVAKFRVMRSRKDSANFCNTSCYGKWMSEHQVGDKHHQWKGDKSFAAIKRRMRLWVAWRDWRESIFKRDDYTCQECKERGVYLEPHHLITVNSILHAVKDLYGEVNEALVKRHKLLFSVNNGITLCRPCHVKTMGKESQFVGRYAPIVI